MDCAELPATPAHIRWGTQYAGELQRNRLPTTNGCGSGLRVRPLRFEDGSVSLLLSRRLQLSRKSEAMRRLSKWNKRFNAMLPVKFTSMKKNRNKKYATSTIPYFFFMILDFFVLRQNIVSPPSVRCFSGTYAKTTMLRISRRNPEMY